jgi:hypothetical protein
MNYLEPGTMQLRRIATVLLIGSFIGFSTTCGSLSFGGHGFAGAQAGQTSPSAEASLRLPDRTTPRSGH